MHGRMDHHASRGGIHTHKHEEIAKHAPPVKRPKRRRGGSVKGEKPKKRLDRKSRCAGGEMASGGLIVATKEKGKRPDHGASDPSYGEPTNETEKDENERARGGKLTAKERQHLPKSDFALPGKGEGPKGAGSGSYPIPNESHARNALARSANKSPEVRAKVRAKVHAKYPDIKIGKD